MKVLTVRQPWAWLLVHAHKNIENRAWGAKHRGPLLIQASARMPRRYDWDAAVAFARERGVEVPAPEQIDFGGVVGVVTLLDCVRSHDSVWFQGPVGWVVADPRLLPFIPCAGRLYVFDAPESVVTQLPADVRHRPAR